MKKFLLPLVAACMFGFAGCSDEAAGKVEVDVTRDLSAISQDAAAANLKTADEMIAAYGSAASELNKEADMLVKEMNKIKMKDITGPEAQKYQQDIAAKRELAKKCGEAKKLFEDRKAALEAEKQAAEAKDTSAPAAAATDIGAVAAVK
ncbi:MAG: hypothetical protein AB7F40_10790 [Victivallaceae bacterium]|nr:hypothetical protein [Victivallaceae bacterium]